MPARSAKVLVNGGTGGERCRIDFFAGADLYARDLPMPKGQPALTAARERLRLGIAL